MSTSLSNKSISGSLSVTGDTSVSGKLFINASAGDEGGEIFLKKAANNTTIVNGVNIDIYQNKLRFWEDGGTNRGFYLDIASGGSSVGTDLATAGNGGNGGNSGTVTSVAMTVPTGLSISGSPITSSGTLALSLASGYAIPTTTELSNAATAYTWGDHSTSGYSKLTATQTFTGTQTILTGADANKGLIVKANSATQSANLQEWQSSTGTVVGRISSTGTLAIDYISNQANSGPMLSFGSASIVLDTRAAGKNGLVVRGYTSQTADLQQWKDVVGTTLAKVDASGNITAASIIKTGGTSSQFLKADGSVDSSTYLTILPAHTHASTDITSGILDIARIPTGTTGTTVALGDHSHTGVYAPASHTHSPSDITGTAVITTDSRLSDARTPTAHTHAQSEITGLVSDLAAKAPSLTAINVQTGTAYTLVLSDINKMVEISNTAAAVVTVPDNTSVPFEIGTTINILRVNTGSVTISPAAGVTLTYTPSNSLRARWSSATLIKRGTNTWVLIGDLT